MSKLEYAWLAVATTAHETIERIRASKRACTILRFAGKVLLAAAVIVAYTLIICRIQAAKDAAAYQKQMEDYRLQIVTRAAHDAAEAMEDPYQLQLNTEADALARVLYGVKDNSQDDLITYCWCVFNRVDNTTFPSTLEDVIAQPNQWMRYSPENPVLENLYQMAREQLDTWHSGVHRPCSSDFVYMNWSPTKIKLRDRWDEGSSTEYWRYGQ